MLLVDHDRSEAGEVDGVLDQRMGADHDVDRTVGETGEDVLSVRPGDPVGEQLDAQRSVAEEIARVGHGDTLQQRPDSGGVLLGEHLGRRHEGRLMAALHRDHHRVDRHDRLAGADVSLEQAVHRMRRREVVLDLGDRPPLGAGQRVRKGVVEPLDQIAIEIVGDATLIALHRPLAQHQHELHPEQLVERQPTTCLLLVADRLRQVDVRQRIETVEHAEALQDRRRHRIGDAAITTPAQRFLDPAGDLPGVDLGLLALRIDRHDPTGAVTDQVDDGIGHL
jgi:hypothetical protein